MILTNLFRQPYLDTDTGMEIGGGSTTETTSTETQSTETTAAETQTTGTEQNTELPKIKVKYNHQEMELPYEEAVTHIQKGMNYDKAVERAREEAAQTAIDKYIANQGYEWNGKPITTEAEYQEALREKELLDKGVDPNEVKRIADDLPEVKEARQLKRDLESMAALRAIVPEITDPSQIPTEVLRAYRDGKELVSEYAIWKVKNDATEQAKAKAQAAAEAEKSKANQTNAAASMGSVNTDGNTDSNFISSEMYAQNKGNQDWVNKNFEKIMKSRAKW